MTHNDRENLRSPERSDHREGTFLAFSLAGEEYGTGILKIKEISGMLPITSIPRTPPAVKGVINFRGRVIPVLDMRLQFGIEAADYTERTCIVVVGMVTDTAMLPTGIVVDEVSEAVNTKPEDMSDPPIFGASVATDYILGMARLGGRVKILLDIDRVLDAEEVAQLSHAA